MGEARSPAGWRRLEMAAASVGRLLRAARGRRIAVVGDAVLDRYVYGEPVRIAREAPVLILRWASEEERPGGAANAARNVASLGGAAELVSLAGDDAPAARLEHLLAAEGVVAHLVRQPGRPTTVKTRFVAGGRETVWQQVLRMDTWEERAPPSPVEEALAREAAAAVRGAEAVIVSEYGGGTLTPRVYAAMLEAARARRVPVLVDSRYRLLEFRGAFAATPNVSEAAQVLGRSLEDEQDFLRAGEKIVRHLGLSLLVLTRGEEGMSVFFPGDRPPVRLLAYRPREVYDVSGAGDTVVSALALGLAQGGSDALAAVLLADVAAGLVVAKRGVATVRAEEVLEAAEHWTPEVYVLAEKA